MAATRAVEGKAELGSLRRGVPSENIPLREQPRSRARRVAVIDLFDESTRSPDTLRDRQKIDLFDTPACHMFLIFSPHRCGSTKLCYELHSRSEGEVLNEPFHVSRRKKLAEVWEGAEFLRDRKPEGIKLIASTDHARWAIEHSDLFERAIIIRRDPVEIAVSLELARQSGRWHNVETPDAQPVTVSDQTIEIVRDAIASVERFAQLRHWHGLRTLALSYREAISEQGARCAAYWLGLSVDPVKEAEPIAGACGPSVRGLEIARNLAHVEERFARHPWREFSGLPGACF